MSKEKNCRVLEVRTGSGQLLFSLWLIEKEQASQAPQAPQASQASAEPPKEQKNQEKEAKERKEEGKINDYFRVVV